MERSINTPNGAKAEEGALAPRFASPEDLHDGPPLGWKADVGRVSLNAADIKVEDIGDGVGFERHANEDDPDGHIILGQE